VSDVHPAWSPDGSKIVFSSDRTGVAGILHMMTVDGSDVTPLGGAGSQVQNPSWSR
jgi:TolB protein